MPRAKLTKSVIDDLPTPAKEVVYWDAAWPGFGVKVTPAGRKVFVVLYRTGWCGFAFAEVHDWDLRSRHPPSGAGRGTKGLRRKA
jgi:hypothetical protein